MAIPSTTPTTADPASHDLKEGRTGLSRLSVNLNSETSETLSELLARRGITATEAVRRALQVYNYLDAERAAGSRLQLVEPRPDGHQHIRELVLLGN